MRTIVRLTVWSVVLLVTCRAAFAAQLGIERRVERRQERRAVAGNPNAAAKVEARAARPQRLADALEQQSMVVLHAPKYVDVLRQQRLDGVRREYVLAAANALHLRQLQRVCRTRAILLGLSRSMGTAGQPRPTGWRQRRRERRSGRCAQGPPLTGPRRMRSPAAQPPAAQPAPARVPQPQAPAAVPQNQPNVTPPGVPIPQAPLPVTPSP